MSVRVLPQSMLVASRSHFCMATHTTDHQPLHYRHYSHSPSLMTRTSMSVPIVYAPRCAAGTRQEPVPTKGSITREPRPTCEGVYSECNQSVQVQSVHV